MHSRISDSLLRTNCLSGLFSRFILLPHDHPELSDRQEQARRYLMDLDDEIGAVGGSNEHHSRQAMTRQRVKSDILEWQAVLPTMQQIRKINFFYLRQLGISPAHFSANGQDANDYTRQWLRTEYDSTTAKMSIEGDFLQRYMLEGITANHENIPLLPADELRRLELQGLTRTSTSTSAAAAQEEKGPPVSISHQTSMLRAGHKFNPFLFFSDVVVRQEAVRPEANQQIGDGFLIGASGVVTASEVDSKTSLNHKEKHQVPAVERFWRRPPLIRDIETGRRHSWREQLFERRYFPSWDGQDQTWYVNASNTRMDPNNGRCFDDVPPAEESIQVDDSFLTTLVPLSNLEVRMQCSYPLLRVPACLLEKERLKYFKDLLESASFKEAVRVTAKRRWREQMLPYLQGAHTDESVTIEAGTPSKPLPNFVGKALRHGLGLQQSWTEFFQHRGQDQHQSQLPLHLLNKKIEDYQTARRNLLQFEFHDETCLTHYDWIVYLLRKLHHEHNSRETGNTFRKSKLQAISVGVFRAAVETRVLQDPVVGEEIYFHLVDPWPTKDRNIPGLQDWRNAQAGGSLAGYFEQGLCGGDAACAALAVKYLRESLGEGRSLAIETFSGVGSPSWPECAASGGSGGGEDHTAPSASSTATFLAQQESKIFNFCGFADARALWAANAFYTNTRDVSTEEWCVAHFLDPVRMAERQNGNGCSMDSDFCRVRRQDCYTMAMEVEEMQPQTSGENLQNAHEDLLRQGDVLSVERRFQARQRQIIQDRGDPRHFQVLQEFAQDIPDFFADNGADFIFIDGDHSEHGVRQDLEHYFWKVKKPGGILAGHDLGLFTFPGMGHGVLDFFEELLNGYCALSGDGTAAIFGNRLEVLEPYCKTGLRMHISSDYVYWIQF
ncbi:unnamed protein product [Amoebophrya sp. A25]|nr:unnamed protein product [Amoebophrya sp. A25]|eukprot:GSA25T00023018001.1